MTKRTKKILRIILISFTALLLLATGVIWYAASNVEKLVKYALIEEVDKSSNGLYKLQMDDLDISITNGTLQIDNISIAVDSSKLYQLELKDESPGYTISFMAKTLQVDVNKLFRIRKGGKLDISRISFEEPTINLFSHNVKQKDYSQNTNRSKSYELPFFGSIAIGKVELLNGSIGYHNQKGKSGEIYSINNFLLELNNIAVDSFINIQNPLIHVGDAFLEANNIHHYMLDSALLFKVKKLAANLKKSQVAIDSLAITPQYEKYEFARKTPNHNDIMDLAVRKVTLSGIHFNELIEYKRLVIDSIMVDSLSFWSFKNKQIPPVIPKEKPLFHQLVHRIKFPILVASITASNSKASYEELSLNGESPGKIDFTDLSLAVKGLTNIPSDTSSFYTAKGQGKLYGKGTVEATFRFPIDSLNDYFEVNGHFGKMDLMAINQMVTPLAFVKITSGAIQRMDFSISGSSKRAKTAMTFLYNDLKVEILNANKEKHKKRKFLSGVVNTLLIKSSNPSGNHAPRKVTAAASERDRFLSNFNYWWRGIREGLLSSIGIPGK